MNAVPIVEFRERFLKSYEFYKESLRMKDILS